MLGSYINKYHLQLYAIENWHLKKLLQIIILRKRLITTNFAPKLINDTWYLSIVYSMSINNTVANKSLITRWNYYQHVKVVACKKQVAKNQL